MFVLALIPSSMILRKAKAAYEFSESKEKINHLLFMDDLKLYSRSEKGLEKWKAMLCSGNSELGEVEIK